MFGRCSLVGEASDPGGNITCFQFAGSAISFTVLHVERSLFATAPLHTNLTSTRDYSVCGANDCQLPNVTRAYMKRYQPLHAETKYLFVASMAAVSAVAILTHYFCLPDEIDWDSESDLVEEGESPSAKYCQQGSEIGETPVVLRQTYTEMQEKNDSAQHQKNQVSSFKFTYFKNIHLPSMRYLISLLTTYANCPSVIYYWFPVLQSFSDLKLIIFR